MIIAAGESLIDMLPLEQSGRSVFLPVPGGSPYNVALALGRLGTPVKFLCRLSRDPFGLLLARTLEESGVDLSLCPRTDALSTLGFVMLEGEHRTPNYVFYTEKTAGCGLVPEDLPPQLPDDLRCLHFGSFSIGAEPIGTALETLLSRRTPQTLVSVDPNIRPFLIRDRAKFEQRLNRFISAAHLLKLSEEDLAWLLPGRSALYACREFLDLGVKLVVLTRGRHGAISMNAKGTSEIAAESVAVVDTVGAGDTFHAALLSWLLTRCDLQIHSLSTLSPAEMSAMLQFAAHAAAITCSRPGCNPPWKHELASPA